MTNIINAMSPVARQNLRGRLHKVAARMVQARGIPIEGEEVTLKTAAYLMGRAYHLHRMEKRAMLDGILNLRQLLRG